VTESNSTTEAASELADDQASLVGYVLDGLGGCRELGERELSEWTPEDGVLWVHIDRASERGRRWLTEESGLGQIICDALLKEDVRPRTLSVHGGLMAVLRGVNFNAGSEPEDMVSLRLWLEQNRVIDLRHRKLREVSDVRERLALGIGPCSSADLLLELADTMINRVDPVVDNLETEIELLEERMHTDDRSELRDRLAFIRRRTNRLRRYLAPQRDALTRLRVEPVDWMSNRHCDRLLEIVERITHIIEDLDWIREHAGVAQDELASLQSEAVGTNMYRVSILTAVFLPPTLLMGLLGVNVAGIPYDDRPISFSLVCALVIVIGLFEYWLLRRFKWL
jgi:zinc transporter